MTHSKHDSQDGKNRINFSGKVFLAALASLLGAAGLSAGSASAASETVLYSFCHRKNCVDGKFPLAGLVIDSKGDLFGTTEEGGTANLGVAFKLSPTGTQTVLHPFQGAPDGSHPLAPLFRDKSGNLFGTTQLGGAAAGGAGTVFMRSTGGVYTVLHSFNGPDGSEPLAGLIADPSGNFYGTTEFGGANLSGTIFKITSSGTLTTVHSFCNLMPSCSDGQNPFAGLFLGKNGNLYGTTGAGGANGFGIVFTIKTDGTGYSVLYNFMGGGDGANPAAGLSADATGTLYGTTQNGGANSMSSGNNGTVFKINPDGTNYAVLYRFCSQLSAGVCVDGVNPVGGVILDDNGNLYGTTLGGGANNHGVVFALTPSGSESVLYSFCNTTNSSGFCLDGSGPEGNLAADNSGNLYGTTGNGGPVNDGIVYKLTSTGFVP